MKQLTIRRVLLTIAVVLGMSSLVRAQVPEGYLEKTNYTEGFEDATSTTIGVGWERWTKSGSISSLGSSTSSPHGGGKCYGTYYGQSGSNYVFAVTPHVKGTIKFYVRRYSTYSAPVIEVYKITDTNGTLSCEPTQDLFYTVEDWPSSTSEWKEYSFESNEYQRYGFRISNAYIDDFSAGSALIPVIKKLEITAYTVTSGTTVNADPDGYVTISAKVTIKNTGNVALGKSTEGENFTLSMAKYLTSSNGNVYEPSFVTIELPDFAVDESKEIEIEGKYPVPTDVNPDSYGEIAIGNIYAICDAYASSAFRNLGYFRIKPYKGIMNIRYDQNTSKTNSQATDPEKNIYFGAAKGRVEKIFHISNSGPADLVITGVNITGEGLDDGDITVEDIEFPYTIASGADPKDVTVVIGGEQGYKEGNVKFITDENGIAIRDNMTVSGDVVAEDRFFADFENLEEAMADWYAPVGSDSWSVGEYSSSPDERLRTTSGNTYWPEYNINDGRLSNGRNNTPGHELYSPLMQFAEGDKISFYAAKKTNYGNDVKLIVSYSADRTNWTELGTITPTVAGTEVNAFPGVGQYSGASGQNMLKRFEFDMPAGNYYISFTAGYVLVDNFVGGKLVEVPYDIVPESAAAGKTKMVNNPLTFSASFRNINTVDVEAEGQVVTLYANGEAVATAEAQVIEAGEAVTYEFEYVPHVSGETALYAEIAIGDYTVKSQEVSVTVQEEAAINEVQVGEVTNSSSDIPLRLNYCNSKSEFIYTSDDLNGLKGNKIVKIAYPYYKTAAVHKAEKVTIWLQNTDDKVVGNAYTSTNDMTKVYEITGVVNGANVESGGYTFETAGTGIEDMSVMEFVLDEAFDYDPTKNLRVTIQSLAPNGEWKQVYFGRTGDKDRVTRYHGIDSRPSFESGAGSNTTGGMPVIILSTEKELTPVTGTVKDSFTGEPIEGAVVKVQAKDEDVYYEAETDADGAWSMVLYRDDLEYTVSATAQGYYASEATELNTEEANDIALLPIYDFKVTVIGPDATALAGVDVYLTAAAAEDDDEAAGVADEAAEDTEDAEEAEETEVIKATTDDNGVATFEALPFGTYTVSIPEPGVYVTPYEGTVEHKDNVGVTINLGERHYDFKVTVTGDDEDATPIEGVAVYVTPMVEDEENAEETEGLVAVTGADGVATFEALPLGKYEVSILNAGYLYKTYSGLAEHKDNDGVTIALEENVLNPTGGTAEVVTTATEGKFDVELAWGLEDIEDPSEYDYFGYTFTVEVNGEKAGEAEETAYTLEGLGAGKYTAKITAVSPSGKESEPLVIEFEITWSGILTITGDDAEWRYFDLKGVEYKAENLQPGIYIRSNGVTVEKIAIK